jgi:phage-related baseplate assembly protein
MSSRYDIVDLSKLPSPAVVEALDYETILADLKARLSALAPEVTATLLESDPLTKFLELLAYESLMLRQRVNDSARAIMLAHASGTDLDHLAALLHVARQVVSPGDPSAIPPVPPVYEDDARLRARAQLAMEGLSTAGPAGAYIFHGLSADPRVADIAVASPTPGAVVVTVLSSEGDGVAAADLLAAVTAALTAEDVRPLTDQVTVQAATPILYAVDATLDLYQGPDAEVVRATSETSVAAFVSKQRRLGEPVTLDGLYAALRVECVRKVTLADPVAAIEPAADAFAHCTAVAVGVSP